jgi:hypothetical protein
MVALLRGIQQARLQQVEFRPPIHLTFDEFQLGPLGANVGFFTVRKMNESIPYCKKSADLPY